MHRRAENHSRPELARDLGLSHAGAVVVGTIIGSGIFLVPSEMMQAVGSARLVYLAWMVGGLLSFFGALTYAELGAMKPQAGGEYVYVRDAYGPLAGFLYSWTWFLIAKPASIATVTTGLVRILETFPIFSFFLHSCISLDWFSRSSVSHPFIITYGQLVAIGATLLISWLNYIGVRRAGEFSVSVHAAKGGDHPRNRRGGLFLSRRNLGELCDRVYWGERRRGGIFRGAGGRAVGLRRLERSDHGGWRDTESATQYSAVADLGRGDGGCALYSGECGGAVCAASGSDRTLGASRVGRGGAGAWACGRQPGVGGHGAFDAGDFEWHHHERCARAVCCGA